MQDHPKAIGGSVGRTSDMARDKSRDEETVADMYKMYEMYEMYEMHDKTLIMGIKLSIDQYQ